MFINTIKYNINFFIQLIKNCLKIFYSIFSIVSYKMKIFRFISDLYNLGVEYVIFSLSWEKIYLSLGKNIRITT